MLCLKVQLTIYRTLHRKLNIEQHEYGKGGDIAQKTKHQATGIWGGGGGFDPVCGYI